MADSFWGIPLPLWGGIAGSSLTYAVTYLRERRKLVEAYRGPQRRSVSEFLDSLYDVRTVFLEIYGISLDDAFSKFNLEEASISGGWNDWIKRFHFENRDKLGKLRQNYRNCRLTVVQPDVFEQVEGVRADYLNLANCLYDYELSFDSRKEDWQDLCSQLKYKDETLDVSVKKLVDVAQKQLSPTQGWISHRKWLKVLNASSEGSD